MRRILNSTLLVAFQFCYLEWPPNNSLFIFQGELEIASKTNKLINNLSHPVILAGLVAQIILLLGVFYPKLNKKVNLIGVVLLFLLVFLFFIVGVFAKNYKIICSTLPYLVLFVIYIFYFRKVKSF
jgi:cobalamin biosynthesis protein CobD/CbiB